MPVPPVKPRLTDSPWFWIYMFSTMALLMLMVMGPKYGHRQTHLEDEFRYGTRTLQRPGGAGSGSDPDAERANAADDVTAERGPLSDGPQPLTHDMLISLWPLRALAAAVMVGSCVMLQWSFVRRRRSSGGFQPPRSTATVTESP